MSGSEGVDAEDGKLMVVRWAMPQTWLLSWLAS